MISIVFSFYNEEACLPELIRQVREVMAKEPDPYELVFVNDDSTDNSARVITSQARVDKEQIVLVNMSRRFGVEECFMAGLNIAQGDAVIFMYTDLQDPPAVIHQMLAKWRNGADVVHSVRSRRIGEHPAKVLVAGLAYRWINNISDIRIPRDAGDFKLMSRRAVDHVCKLRETEPYLRGLVSWVGFNQDAVTYELMPRRFGSSKVPLFGKKAFKTLVSGLMSFSSFPVYLIFFLSIAGLLGVVFLSVYLSFVPQPWNFFGWLCVGGLLLWALSMFAVGILGLYILRIYHNTTGRPSYVIKEVIR